eukprot:1158762-Pelagomonas_calceolata.AAC.4
MQNPRSKALQRAKESLKWLKTHSHTHTPVGSWPGTAAVAAWPSPATAQGGQSSRAAGQHRQTGGRPGPGCAHAAAASPTSQTMEQTASTLQEQEQEHAGGVDSYTPACALG